MTDHNSDDVKEPEIVEKTPMAFAIGSLEEQMQEEMKKEFKMALPAFGIEKVENGYVVQEHKYAGDPFGGHRDVWVFVNLEDVFKFLRSKLL